MKFLAMKLILSVSALSDSSYITYEYNSYTWFLL